jgi:hypothetical protein
MLLRNTVHEDSFFQYLGNIDLLFPNQVGLVGKDSDFYPGGDRF